MNEINRCLQLQVCFHTSCPTLPCCYCFSLIKSCPPVCDLTGCSTPGSPSLTVSQSFVGFMSSESVMLSKHLILSVTFSFCLQSFPAPGSALLLCLLAAKSLLYICDLLKVLVSNWAVSNPFLTGVSSFWDSCMKRVLQMSFLKESSGVTLNLFKWLSHIKKTFTK